MNNQNNNYPSQNNNDLSQNNSCPPQNNNGLLGNTPWQNYSPPAKPVVIYSVLDVILAALAFVFGYLFIKWVLTPAAGLSGMIYIAAFSVTSFLYAKLSKRKIGAEGLILLLINIAFSSVMILSSNAFIKGLVVIFEVLSYLYWYFIVFGNRDQSKIGSDFALDMTKAVFVMPFGSFGTVFPAFFGAFKSKSSGKKALYIFLGLLLAIIPSAIVISLLASADTAFAKIADMLNVAIFEKFFENLIWFVVSLPFAMFIFGMIYSNGKNKYKDTLNSSSKQEFRTVISKIPQIVICAAMIPLCVIYLIFIISQLGYYFSAFSNFIPDGYTVAEYARTGFFQLCTVAGLNAAAIIIAGIFIKKDESGQKPVPLRIITVITSVFTLLIIATALRKMILYIQTLGLTILRVYTSWFMILLAVIFIFTIIKQIYPKFNWMIFSASAFVILFGVLCFSDVDARIAETNVDLYLSGKLDKCDVTSFYELSYSAAEYAIPLLDCKDETVANAAERYLNSIADRIEHDYYFGNDYSWKMYTVSIQRVADSLSEALNRKIVISGAS